MARHHKHLPEEVVPYVPDVGDALSRYMKRGDGEVSKVLAQIFGVSKARITQILTAQRQAARKEARREVLSTVRRDEPLRRTPAGDQPAFDGGRHPSSTGSGHSDSGDARVG